MADFTGTDGNDVLLGTDDNDNLYGLDGADFLKGCSATITSMAAPGAIVRPII